MGITYKPARTFTCKKCNQEYKRYGNSPSTYCSRKCQYEDKIRITLSCMNCSKEYEVAPSEVKWSKLRGEKLNFCSQECRYLFKRGKNNPLWKGGKHITKRGYVKIWKPEHPNNIYGYCYEHRIVMEEHLGRLLTPDEDVHHINEIKGDNRIENLQLLSSSEHSKLTILLNHQRKKLKK